jgi:hypothetical protein
MEILLPIIGITWIILNIILFFKLWTACNDIRRIADKCDPNGKITRERIQRDSEKEQLDAFIHDN